jgi:protein gp37
MGETTKIPWCDATFNLWWGCQKIAPECANCYARDFANRMHPALKLWGGDDSVRRISSESYWKKLAAWDKKAAKRGKPFRVFVGSMMDLFEFRDHDQTEAFLRFFGIVAETPNLTYLCLTKRPENAVGIGFPPNVWIGTSAGTQATWDRNVMHLAKVSATYRFVSMEPMLEPIEMSLAGTLPKDMGLGYTELYERINWVIVGAESGHNRRPFDREWARLIRDECSAFDVPFFYKQEIGPDRKKIETPPLDGVVHVAFPDIAM